MKYIYILILLFFSCHKPDTDKVFHLKKFVELDLKSGTMKELWDFPFQTWEFQGTDSLIIDGIVKKYEKNKFFIKIFGNDLESEYSIKSWNDDEIMLSKMDYQGKDYIFLLKR